MSLVKELDSSSLNELCAVDDCSPFDQVSVVDSDSCGSLDIDEKSVDPFADESVDSLDDCGADSLSAPDVEDSDE